MSDRTELKEAVERARLAGHETEALDLLTRYETSNGKLDAADALWVQRTRGLLFHSLGQTDSALEHLQRAYQLEPRDPDVGVAYGDLLFRQGQRDESIKVMRALLIHHKTSLDPILLASIYRYLGEYHAERGELKQARAAYDDALRLDPGDKSSIDGMIAIISQLSPEEAERARRMLLKRLEDPEARVHVLLRHAEERLGRDADVNAALALYDEALAIQPDSRTALERRAELLVEWRSPVEGAEALRGLAAALPSVERAQQIAHLERAHALLDKAAAPAKHVVRVLDDLLDLEPERLDRFEDLSSRCAAESDWAELARAYQKMIKRYHTPGRQLDERLLPLLWRNLAELWAAHLDRPEEAIEAYAAAARLMPRDAEVRAKLLELCRTREDRAELCYQTARELSRLRPGEPAARQDLAALALKAGQYDEALCLLRVLRAENQLPPGLEAAYERLGKGTLRLPTQPLTQDHRRVALRPKGQSIVLNTLMAIGGVVLNPLFAHDLAYHNLTDRERLDPEEELLFNRVYLAVARCLGADPIPRVYRKQTIRGMANAMLDKPAFVVGPDLLAGRSDREIAFIVAQNLCLQRPEYVLTTMQEPVHLKLIVLVLANWVDPSVPVQASQTVSLLRRSIERRITPELQGLLVETVHRMVADNLDVNVDSWVDTAAEEALRTGLLFCEDVAVADALADSPGVLGAGSSEARLRRLHEWAMSPEYLAVRKGIGLAG